MVQFNNDWDVILKDEFEKQYYLDLRKILANEYKTQRIFPEAGDIFSAFQVSPYADTKVVILGQDPYHGAGQAHGMAFSVQKDVKIPPSLVNMYKELKDDLGIDPPRHGNLSYWAGQGVLLLNTSLTVREGLANSHKGIGWTVFTDNVIKLINLKTQPVVFILWGNNAKSKQQFITNPIHHTISSAHPSPLSAYNGFFGSKPFSKTNEFLAKSGTDPIDWKILQ